MSNATRAALVLATLATLVLAAPASAANSNPPHDGSVLTKALPLSTTSWKTVLTSTLQTSQKRNLQASGWIDFVNPGSKSVVVTLRMFHTPKGGTTEIQAGRQRVTVPAHGRASAPFEILCSQEPAGTYKLGVQALSTGPVSVAAGSESALALPSPGAADYLPNVGVIRTTGSPLGKTNSAVLRTTLSNGSSVTTASACRLGFLKVVSSSR